MFLQLLCMSLSACRHYYPASVVHRFSQSAMFHAVFALRKRARPLEIPPLEATDVFTFITAR